MPTTMRGMTLKGVTGTLCFAIHMFTDRLKGVSTTFWNTTPTSRG